jgi:IS5 family transposase
VNGWEDWMRELDRVLDDEPWVALVYEAWSQRHPRSRTRGRPGIPAEVVLRLLALQHIFDWSFDDVEREVKASWLYRPLARVAEVRPAEVRVAEVRPVEVRLAEVRPAEVQTHSIFS